MFKHIPNGKGMVYVPNEKGIMAYILWIIWFVFFGSFYLFTIIVNWYKVNFSQNLGGLKPPPGFYRPDSSLFLIDFFDLG